MIMKSEMTLAEFKEAKRKLHADIANAVTRLACEFYNETDVLPYIGAELGWDKIHTERGELLSVSSEVFVRIKTDLEEG